MKTYYFHVTLSGKGDDLDEAWNDAVSSFAVDPGNPVDGEYDIFDDDEPFEDAAEKTEDKTSKTPAPTYMIGTQIITLVGEQDQDAADNKRKAAPGEVGEIFAIDPNPSSDDGYCYPVTFNPSGVWVVLFAQEIRDPAKYEVLEERA